MTQSSSAFCRCVRCKPRFLSETIRWIFCSRGSTVPMASPFGAWTHQAKVDEPLSGTLEWYDKSELWIEEVTRTKPAGQTSARCHGLRLHHTKLHLVIGNLWRWAMGSSLVAQIQIQTRCVESLGYPSLPHDSLLKRVSVEDHPSHGFCSAVVSDLAGAQLWWHTNAPKVLDPKSTKQTRGSNKP